MVRPDPSSTTAARVRRDPQPRVLKPREFPRRLFRNESAAISPMFALLLIPISASIAYAVEVGGWHYIQRAAQNAADSAAIAAASNNVSAGNAYLLEARAAANKLGFQNTGTTSVNVASVTCPAGSTGTTCYQATISTTFPRLFSRMVGFTGPSSTISAAAIATAAGGGTATNTCIWTFYNLQTNGTPDADLSGCVAMSNGGMTCTGNGIHAAYAVAGGTVSGNCANVSPTNNLSFQTIPADPYASRTIPSDSCGGTYPQFDNKFKVASSNEISGSLSGTVKLCGDIQLKGDVTLAAGTTLVIYNGRLDVNGYKFNASSGTVVFSGTNSSTYHHYPIDSANGPATGELKINAPTTTGATWKDIAIYQDPALTTNVGFTYAGNKPTWTVTGVVYLPKATVTFSGVVGKYAGVACQILVAYDVTINGTGKIIGDASGCSSAGYSPPTYTGVGIRAKLVS